MNRIKEKIPLESERYKHDVTYDSVDGMPISQTYGEWSIPADDDNIC
jgi:hypothetical protein